MAIDKALSYYSFYRSGCDCGQVHALEMKAWIVRKSNEAIQTLWDKGFQALDFRDAFFKSYITDKSQSYQEEVESGLDTNVRKLLKAGDDKGYQRFVSMRENVWQFGAGSVRQEYNAMQQLADVLKNEGKDLSEETSQRMLSALQDRYQIQFKATEDATIKASAVMAKKWQVITQSGKNLKYVTVGDSHVRVTHAKLDGLVFPPDHSFWDKNYPPKDHGCRCDVEETNDPEYTGTIPIVPSDPGISGNSGKTGIVFTDKHPYLAGNQGKDGNWHLIRSQSQKVVSALEKLQSFTVKTEGFEGKINITGTTIKKMRATLPLENQDYAIHLDHFVTKLEEPQEMEVDRTDKNGNYDPKKKPSIVKYRYFPFETPTGKRFLNVEEMFDGSHRLYTITNEIHKKAKK